jgi:hypothetical protein
LPAARSPGDGAPGHRRSGHPAPAAAVTGRWPPPPPHGTDNSDKYTLAYASAKWEADKASIVFFAYESRPASAFESVREDG